MLPSENFRIHSPLDLHVLGAPPAFVLSQDQTLVFNPFNTHAYLHKHGAKLSNRIDCRFLLLSLYRFQGTYYTTKDTTWLLSFLSEPEYNNKRQALCQGKI
jgi:hypothetical protein